MQLDLSSIVPLHQAPGAANNRTGPQASAIPNLPDIGFKRLVNCGPELLVAVFAFRVVWGVALM